MPVDFYTSRQYKEENSKTKTKNQMKGSKKRQEFSISEFSAQVFQNVVICLALFALKVTLLSPEDDSSFWGIFIALGLINSITLYRAEWLIEKRSTRVKFGVPSFFVYSAILLSVAFLAFLLAMLHFEKVDVRNVVFVMVSVLIIVTYDFFILAKEVRDEKFFNP